MLTLKRDMAVRVSEFTFVLFLIYLFASWFLLAPPGEIGEAYAGQLEFDGVPVDITTAANEDLVLAPGSGGNSQVGTGTGTNTHATTNNDLHVTGVLEVDGASYFDSTVNLGDTTSDTITVSGYFGSSLIPSLDSTYDLGSASLAWRCLYADIISGVNTSLALNPPSGYSLTGSVTKSASAGNEVAYDYAAIIDKAAGNYTGIKLNLTQTSASGPATANFLFDLQLGGVSMFNVDAAGNVIAVGTITGSGAAINGTTSHTFTVNSNNDNALTTLRLGGSGGSNGQLTTASGNLVIDSNGGTVDINDGTLDLSTQTVDVALNDAVDSLNIDADTLSVDALNNRVGIGTSAPGNQLHVSDPTGAIEVAKFEGINSTAIRIDAPVGANTSTTRNYVGGTLSSEAGYSPVVPGSGYYISMSGTRRLTLDSNGYLGLGDTTPVANLVVGSDAGAAVAGAGDAYIQNDLEVDGTLYAASAAIAGTSSDTFTIDTDNSSATPTLTFGNGGNPFITTPAGNLNLQPASAVIVRDATAPAPAKATAAGSLFVENIFENTGIAYHYDDITLYDKKSFAVISSLSGAPDYAHSIYMSQSDNIMQFKEWDTFKFTNTSANVDLITLTPTAGMTLLNEDVVDNAVSDILKIEHSTTNVPAAGIGTGLAYYVEDAGNLQKHGSIDTVLTTVTQGSENADMIFKISQAGVLSELMRLNSASDRVDISGDLNVTGTISGALSSSGTASDTWEVNTDGNSVTINSAGQTSDHSYTFPDVSGKVLTTNMSDAIVAVTLNNAVNALNFDADTLTIDASNNRVGINTGNPGAQLEVVGALKVVTGSENMFCAAAAGPYFYIQAKDVAGTDYTRVGGWSSTATATNLVLQPAGGNIGIGGTFDGNPTTLAPSYMVSLDGQAGRTIGMERHQAAGQAGNDLTVQSGGAYATGSDLDGGNLVLKAGTATGSGASAIMFQAAKAGAAGAADNDPATKAIIAGTSMTFSPHGAAAGNTLELRFNELAAGGVNYVGFKAPDAIGSDLIWTLPGVDGSSGHVLKTDGLGTLSFGAVGGSTAITGTTNDTFEVNTDGNSVTVSSAGQTGDRVFTFPDATGQVLTNNMPADVAVALGGGVDALNFDSNTLSIDANNNRVGIGNAAPEAALDVSGQGYFNSNIIARSGVLVFPAMTGFIGGYDSAGDRAFFFSGVTNGTGGVISRKPAIFDYGTFGFTRDGGLNYDLFISSAGYVGMGDATPAANLVVGDDTGAVVSGAGSAYIQNDLEVDGTLYAAASGLTGTTSRTFTVNSDNTTGEVAEVIFGGAGAGSGKISTTVGNLNIDSAGGTVDINDGIIDLSTQTVDVTLNAAADALNFDSNTLSIDASANRVGIGTASPQYNLDVVETARINNTAGSASLLLTGTGDVYAYSYVDLLNDTGNKSWNIQHRKAAGFVDDFMIEEYDGAAYYQRFIIRPGGIVGIGTTDFDGTPALGYLTVKGTTNDGTTNIFVGRDSDEANVAYLDTNGNFTLSGSISASASSLPGTTASSFNINSDTNGVILSAPDGRTNAGTFTFPDVAAASKVLTTNMSDAIVAVTLKSDAVNGLNFDSNTLSIDAQNNRVGIGMAAPLHALDIEGTARVKNSGGIGTLVLEGTGDTYKYSALNLFNDTGNKLWAIQHRQIAGEVNNFAIEEYDGTDYTRRLSIIPGGYVGIPDMSPVAQLVIGDDTGASVSGAGSAYIQNNLEVDGTLYVGASTITGTTADTFEVNSDGFGAVISTTNRSTDGTFTFPNVAGAAQVLTNNMSDAAVAVTLNAAAINGLSFDTDTFSIDAQNNKVGIGTTSPSERLTVDGGASYSGYIETKSTNANYSGMLFRDADGVQWGLYKNATADPMLQFGRYTDGVWQAAPLSFLRNGDVNFGDRYVGIGDTDPVASLVVGSDAGAAVSGAGSVYVQNNLEVDGTLTAATANISGTTADTFTVNSDGTAASSALALGAAGTTGGSITTGAGNLTIDSAGGTVDINDGVLDLSTQTVDVTLNAAADALNFDSNTLSIDASANRVGIGTAAPDFYLTIAPPGNAVAGLGLYSSGAAGSKIDLGKNGSTFSAISYSLDVADALEFRTGGTTTGDTRMVIDSGGNVGIGVTGPAAALDVQTAVTAASANAYGARLQQTLTASANSDALNALYINPTFADGGFTGVKHNGIAFPDAQEVKINLGYNAAKSKWLGIDSNWRMAFSDDSGFAFYNSSDNTSWGTEWMRVGGTIEMYSDLLVGTSGTNRWLKMRGNILFEEDDDYIGTYNTGIITLGNLQSTGVATTVNFGRAGGIDVMNFNRGGTTYNFLTLKSAGTDDITLDPAGGDVSVDGNLATTSNGSITAGGSGAVQCGTGAFKSSDGTAGLTGTYNIDGSAAGTIATMQFKNGILVAVTTR